MSWLDVTGQGKHLINLDLVRRIKMEDFGEQAEIVFTHANGEESIFRVSSGRLAVIDDLLHDLKVIAT